MGYQTDLIGKFEFDTPLSAEQVNVIQAFNKTRHGGNLSPWPNVPGFWCQWTTEDGTSLEWDGNEKFYEYVAWLEYLIKNFFEPWGKQLDGIVQWSGEEQGDVGTIVVIKNNVSVLGVPTR